MSELSGINSVAFVSGAATDPKIQAGTGSPEGVVTGNVGDVWLRQDGGVGTTYYVKESGTATTTGWVVPGAGVWEFVQEQQVAGAAVTDIDFTGLDGDTDIRYRIFARVVKGATGAISYSVQPNQIASNQDVSRMLAGGTGSVLDEPYTFLLMTRSGLAVGSVHTCTADLDAATGQIRGWRSKNSLISTSAAGSAEYIGGGWNESATNITNLRFHSNVGSGWGIGTVIQLWKATQ
jgi:hypothetical protein